MIKKALIFFLTVLPLAAFAQVTIKGRVLSQHDTKPVANVSVFISNATIGDKTNTDGTFTLTNVKPGKYNLIISIIGFDIETVPLSVDATDINLPDIIIFRKTIGLNEVVIKSDNNDFERKRNYDWFKEEFLGTSELAKECKILNPELLDFTYDYKKGILKASSIDFLIIENNALGYSIKYKLTNFELNNLDPLDKSFYYAGYALFEELQGSASQKEKWRAQRQQVYEGSQMHFLRSALENTLEQNAFRVLRRPLNSLRPPDSIINEKLNFFNRLKSDGKQFRDSLKYWEKKAALNKFQPQLLPHPVTKQDLIHTYNNQGLYTFDCSGEALFITYNKHHRFGNTIPTLLSSANNTDNTFVVFNQPYAIFDANGAVQNPRSLAYDGVWLKPRIAGLLPLNYEPEIITDNTTGANLIARLGTYTASDVIENAYLHLDKPYYAAGDTLYFKSYVTQGGEHKLSQLSEVLYVDLVNADNNIQKSLVLHLNQGLAWGDIALPDTIKQGNYNLRAYTNYMRNAGDGYFFGQTVAIANSPRTDSTALSIKPGKKSKSNNDATNLIEKHAKFDVQFLPEGGNFIVGNKTAIAFKAIGANGLGFNIKGNITDNNGREITSLATSHLGMGVFYLTAESGKSYKAQITYPDGSIDVIDIPQAVDEGYGFSIDNTNPFELKLMVKAGKRNALKELNVIAQCRGIIYYSGKISTNNKPLIIENEKFPSGVVQFTLFTPSGEPMNERVVFIQNDDKLKLALTTDKQKYAARQKVRIDINASDKLNTPVVGSFSVAVTDETRVPFNDDNGSTILTNLLLTSNLIGQIEQPNYYFINNNDKIRANLDVLMLTQGYQRYVWRKILSNVSPPNNFQAQKGMKLSGYIKTNGGEPVPNGKIQLFTKADGGRLIDTLADANGRFVFTNLTFNDTLNMVLKAKDEKGNNNVKIHIDTIPPSFKTNSYLADSAFNSNDLLTYLEGSKKFQRAKLNAGINKKTIMLNTVSVKAKNVTKLENSQNLNGKGNANFVITADKLETSGSPILYNALKTRAPFVQFFNGEVRSNRTGSSFKNPVPPSMLIVIDGMPTEQYTALLDIHTENVESVEILAGTNYGVIYGPQGASGVILVTTKKVKKAQYNTPISGILTYKAKGYYKAREFYSPKYDNPNTNKYIPDLRSTIYWQPNIITDEKGKSHIEFFNADLPGKYKVVVEGIDTEGNIGRQVYRYNVD